MTMRLLLVLLAAVAGNVQAFSIVSSAKQLISKVRGSPAMPEPPVSTSNPPLSLSPEQLGVAIPTIMGLGQAHFAGQCLYAVTKLGVPNVIGSGTMSVEEIATAVGAVPARLHRCLRFLTAMDIFKESANEDGQPLYSLAPAGAVLQTNVQGQPSYACGMLHWLEPPLWKAWMSLPDYMVDEKSPATPFKRANNMDIFDYYGKHPESADPFNEFMATWSANAMPSILQVAPWSKHKGGRVLDVGGGYGITASAIQAANPEVEMLSLDLASVVEAAKANNQAPDNIQLLAGDMFDAATYPDNLSAVYLKHILHDWSDAACVKILQACRDALPSGGKIYVIDAILPDAGDPVSPVSARQFHIDMLMMVIGGQERTRTQFQALAAEAGLEIKSFEDGIAKSLMYMMVEMEKP